MSKFRGTGKWIDGISRTNTGSSIRGTISAPIMQDDDEFPIRLPGTGIATPLGKDSIERQRIQLRSSAGSGHALQPDPTSRPSIDVPRASPSPPQPLFRAPPAPVDQPTRLRMSTGSMPSVPSAKNGEKPQRKKSSLGSVLRKIFGKRRKESVSPHTIKQDPGVSNAGQHRSDPTALKRNAKDVSSIPKRSASLPINEFNQALRSHSTVMNDVSLPQASVRDSTQADGRQRPRGATTPSRLWTPNKSPGYMDWSGLSPRPASTQVRDSSLGTGADSDAAVGIAVTNGSHPNRRSRSLGELRGIVAENLIVRRRSDEIRYWRESYDPGLLSPISSNRADAEEPILLDPLERTPALPEEQPQPFNFGPMGEMAGMSITQAASLETRVQRLEDRTNQIENAVYQINRNASKEPMVFESPPKRNLRRDRSVSTNRPQTDSSETTLPKQPRNRDLQPGMGRNGSQKRSSSHGSSRPSTTMVQNPYTPSFDNFSHPNLVASDEQTHKHQTSIRPLSTSTTIRGLSPTISKDSHLTGEHWAALTNMLLAEQAARQDLELLILDLQQQIQIMRSPKGSSYPTPEADDHIANPMKHSLNQDYSASEEDDSSDDEGRYAHEDFQTPNEDSTHLTDGIFGGANGTESNNAPRTMSLSQLTLGKGIRSIINFQGR